jgi:hypothetical protein
MNTQLIDPSWLQIACAAGFSNRQTPAMWG